jgi:hypothetical protein
MTTIRIHCPQCPTGALLRPEQVLVMPHAGGATYLYACPACGRVSDGPAGPEQLLLLAAAGVPMPAPTRGGGR